MVLNPHSKNMPLFFLGMGEHPWNPNIVDDLALPPHAFPFQILKD
jgi:hypothetical protein